MPSPPKVQPVEYQQQSTSTSVLNEREKGLLTASTLSDIERDIYIQKQDFSGLNEPTRAELCSYVATLAGLDPRMGYVACINLQGKMVPYIKAAGITEIARNKVKSLRVTEPKFIFRNAQGGSMPLAVSIVCTVETIDGKTFEDIGCVDCSGQTAFDVMKASTRARSRALKLSVGIHLLTDEELSDVQNKKVENKNV